MPELKEPLTEDEAAHLLQLKASFMQMSAKYQRAFRRKIRYRLFRIREGKEEFDQGLKKLIESQFEPSMRWETFTFDWDVQANDPLKVVSIYEWAETGGKFEVIQVVCDDGVTRPQRICEPTAFTKQEM